MKLSSVLGSNLKWRLLNKLAMPLQKYLYHPYQPEAYCYMIPKVSDDHQGHCAQGLPIPPRRLWSMSPKNTVESYLDLGKQNTERMLEMVSACGAAPGPGSRTLDFGCGTGRTLRWLKETAETAEVWGIDIRAEHIAWCKHHLTPPFRFFTSTAIPHLPFEDGYFDLIYAFSVFSHIEDLADMWFLELRRILKDNGAIFVTIQDEHTLERMREASPSWFSEEPFASYAKAEYGMITRNRGAGSNVYYDLEYLRRTLVPFFEVALVSEEAYVWQTGLVLTKKPSA